MFLSSSIDGRGTEKIIINSASNRLDSLNRVAELIAPYTTRSSRPHSLIVYNIKLIHFTSRLLILKVRNCQHPVLFLSKLTSNPASPQISIPCQVAVVYLRLNSTITKAH